MLSGLERNRRDRRGVKYMRATWKFQGQSARPVLMSSDEEGRSVEDYYEKNTIR